MHSANETNERLPISQDVLETVSREGALDSFLEHVRMWASRHPKEEIQRLAENADDQTLVEAAARHDLAILGAAVRENPGTANSEALQRLGIRVDHAQLVQQEGNRQDRMQEWANTNIAQKTWTRLKEFFSLNRNSLLTNAAFVAAFTAFTGGAGSLLSLAGLGRAATSMGLFQGLSAIPSSIRNLSDANRGKSLSERFTKILQTQQEAADEFAERRRQIAAKSREDDRPSEQAADTRFDIAA